MNRPQFRLLHGGADELPPLKVATTHRTLHGMKTRVLEAAQNWTAFMIASGLIGGYDMSTEHGRLTLAITDAVTELETYGTGAVPSIEA